MSHAVGQSPTFVSQEYGQPSVTAAPNGTDKAATASTAKDRDVATTTGVQDQYKTSAPQPTAGSQQAQAITANPTGLKLEAPTGKTDPTDAPPLPTYDVKTAKDVDDIQSSPAFKASLKAARTDMANGEFDFNLQSVDGTKGSLDIEVNGKSFRFGLDSTSGKLDVTARNGSLTTEDRTAILSRMRIQAPYYAGPQLPSAPSPRDTLYRGIYEAVKQLKAS